MDINTRKQKIIEGLLQEKKSLIPQLEIVEKKNNLLTGIIDTDYFYARLLSSINLDYISC